MFRGKESSNRIELSRLVQDSVNFFLFWAPCGSGGGGGWIWVGGGWILVGVVGVPPHMCTHMHAHTQMHTYMRVVNMIISCKWPPPLGESLGIPYDVICVCTCVCMHACACMCTLSPSPTHIHQPPTPRGTPGISQNSIALKLIEIFQFHFKDLKSVETSPLMGGCMVWWVDGWGSGQITKNLKIVD